MSENSKPSQLTNIWRQLIYDGLAIGIFIGLLEVCWVYLLPTFLPGRKYMLPISTVGRFVLIAILVDIFLAFVAVGFLGVLLWGIRKIWRQADSFRHWPAVIRFFIIAGGFSYFYVALVYTYYLFHTTLLKRQAAMIGVLLIIPISALVVWLLGLLRRRFGKAAPKVVWVFALVALFSIIVPNYLRYRSVNGIDINMDLPAINTNNAPNVLLVTLDTLRADHVGCYGNKIVQTPVLDALAADSCLFEAAFSQAPTTTASHCSIMTSTQVARHCAMNGSAMKSGFPTLAEILQAGGYETASFVSCTMVRSGNSGLDRGFDYYEDSISPYVTFLRNDECQFVLAVYLFAWLQDNQIRGNIVSNRALAWLDKRTTGPFFCWLHYFDPHDPYDAPGSYKDMYDGKIDPNLPCLYQRVHYAGEVTYVDTQLGRVIKTLKDKALYDDMLIIVTADHGEAFGEKHGDVTEFGHGNHLYDTTQHIPLLIKMPGRKAAGQRIKDVVQLVDLAPTVLDYLGASFPKTFEGKSLLDLLNGGHRSEPGVAYSENRGGAMILGIGQIRSMRMQLARRTPEIKYIHNIARSCEELYDIVTDPNETINIYHDRPELAKSCYQSIEETLGVKPLKTTVTTVDPKVLEQLKSLGYIGND